MKQIDFLLADAGQASLPKDFDALFSRFGVMFFEQPAVAFRNLRGSLRPGGQLGFVAWQEPAANPWLTHVTQCVLPFLPEAPPAPDPRAPGPFAFGDPDYMEAALMRAGFGEIEIREFRADVPFGAGGLQAAMDFALQVGPAARLTAELPPATLERVQVALSELFEANLVDGVVSLPGATWIVAARN